MEQLITIDVDYAQAMNSSDARLMEDINTHCGVSVQVTSATTADVTGTRAALGKWLITLDYEDLEELYPELFGCNLLTDEQNLASSNKLFGTNFKTLKALEAWCEVEWERHEQEEHQAMLDRVGPDAKFVDVFINDDGEIEPFTKH